MSKGFSLPGAMMLVAFVGVVAASLSRLATDASLSQRGIEARLAAHSLRLSILRHLSDPATCIENFELVNPVTNSPARSRIINIAGNSSFVESFDLNQQTYEGGKILIRNMEFQAFNPLVAGSEYGVAIFQMNFESVGQISGPRELVSISRPLLLAAHLNPTGEIVECAAIGDDEGNFWQITGIGRNSSGSIFYQDSRVGIGTMIPDRTLTVQGSVQVQDRIEAENLQATDSITTENFLSFEYFHTSDLNLKKNLARAPGLETVLKLRGVEFDWQKSGAHSFGVVAQEVSPYLKSAVEKDSEGSLLVDPSQIYAVLINAIDELEIEQRKLETRMETLHEKLSDAR